VAQCQRRYNGQCGIPPARVPPLGPGLLARVSKRPSIAGATTVNIPDTVGYTTPTEYGKLLTCLRQKVKNIHRRSCSVHCRTMTSGWPWPTASRPSSTAPARWSARSTESGSGPGTPPWKRSSCPENPQGLLLFRGGHYHRTDLSGSPSPDQHHRDSGASQQRPSWGQCLCPRGGHPPGRGAEREDHL